MDLRWWADGVRMGRAAQAPSRRVHQAMWGWSARQVTKLVKDEGRWVDPMHAGQPRTGGVVAADGHRTGQTWCKTKNDAGSDQARGPAEPAVNRQRTALAGALTAHPTQEPKPHSPYPPRGATNKLSEPFLTCLRRSGTARPPERLRVCRCGGRGHHQVGPTRLGPSGRVRRSHPPARPGLWCCPGRSARRRRGCEGGGDCDGTLSHWLWVVVRCCRLAPLVVRRRAGCDCSGGVW
jgi:hypothetical protein